MDHLVAVAQLLGHDPEDPGLVLRVARVGERRLVLLDRAELRRGLRADDREELLGGLGIELLGHDRLRLAGAFADLDLLGHVLLEPGAQAERLVFREVGVPLLGEPRVVREVVPLPMHDRLVVLAWELVLLVGHVGASGSLLTS